jgi:hypothetical protein
VLQVTSGAVLIAMGVLVLTGELFRLNIEVQQALDGLGVNFFRSITGRLALARPRGKRDYHIA